MATGWVIFMVARGTIVSGEVGRFAIFLTTIMAVQSRGATEQVISRIQGSDDMSGIPAIAWVMFAADVVLPVLATMIFYRRSRPAAGSTVAGTPGSDSQDARRAGYKAALHLARVDLIGVSGVALVCMIVLRSNPSGLILTESVLFGCCLVSLAFNIWHSRRVARQAASTPDRPGRGW
ncbi:Hypothetical protein PROPJV5_0913 [Propionibacterium ruminifibrarum]|uniref:Uncharacterized protein n=2 Tax=Propionibacterium ruminifibrarum TaxID=1962131 RepID=A0A375I3H9_9ACTN|nr:Hypothetical protein PROPJV5_0913 [Propionibacterium ruminifibrarum]